MVLTGINLGKKYSIFGVKVQFNDQGIILPHKGERWIKERFAAIGLGKDRLIRQNEARIHQ